jgi:hypothetical protein
MKSAAPDEYKLARWAIYTIFTILWQGERKAGDSEKQKTEDRSQKSEGIRRRTTVKDFLFFGILDSDS